ncbi:MAG: insulinase family protein [Micromonosporaceae bacterium]|nr:insulinase family protein [Micromonosporaceae bacterium]
MIIQTVVDGIPTLLAPGSGPARGGITFRVGRADETLARSGITHLVEHLALHRLGVTDYHYNGTTGATVTHFFSQGSPESIAEYLTNVCAALHDLPLHRLDVEKEILRTESSSRSHSPIEQLPLWRYGARGYGVLSYPEWGLNEVAADDIRAWAAHYFTRDNAVLWFTGMDVPENLRLNLPAGTRAPLPALTSALPRTPAWFCGPPRTVAFHTHVPRSAAAQVFTGVLEHELFRALRQEGGYSYTVATDYDPIDTEQAAVVALADAHPDKQAAALGAFVDVLAKLRWGTVDQADLDGVRAKAAESLRDPDAEAHRLPMAAFNILIGSPVPDIKQHLRDIEAVTADDVKQVAERAFTAGLLMTPNGHGADWAGFVAAPTKSETVVDGVRYAMRGDSSRALVVGPAGVSTTRPEGAATVHFAQTAVLLAWPDGGRMLIGHDGITCQVEPTLYPVDAATLARIDGSVPPGTVVRMPARDPEAIPRPPKPTKADSQRPDGPPRSRGLMVAGAIVLGVLSVMCTLFSALATHFVITDPDSDVATKGIAAAVFWGATAAVVLPCILLIRRLRR